MLTLSVEVIDRYISRRNLRLFRKENAIARGTEGV